MSTILKRLSFALALSLGSGLIVAVTAAIAQPAQSESEPEFAYDPNVVVTAQAQRTGLALVVLRDGRREGSRRIAVLAEPWLYCSPLNNGIYVVPSGYVTDFASVPWFGRMFFPPFGDWAEAAVIHDWLYDVGEPAKRSEADAIFRKAIDEQSDNLFAVTMMHWAVRLGGGGAYREAERRDPDTWRSHFVDRHGEVLPEPPIVQPKKAVWRTGVDCNVLDDADEVDRLIDEYFEEQDAQEDQAALARGAGP